MPFRLTAPRALTLVLLASGVAFAAAFVAGRAGSSGDRPRAAPLPAASRSASRPVPLRDAAPLPRLRERHTGEHARAQPVPAPVETPAAAAAASPARRVTTTQRKARMAPVESAPGTPAPVGTHTPPSSHSTPAPRAAPVPPVTPVVSPVAPAVSPEPQPAPVAPRPAPEPAPSFDDSG